MSRFVLNILSGLSSSYEIKLGAGQNSVGSADENNVVLDHPTISEEHAVIGVEAAGVWIQDLGSTNGTFVNGKQIHESVWLKSGDQIGIGNTVVLGFEVVLDSEPEETPEPQSGVSPITQSILKTLRSNLLWVGAASGLILIVLALAFLPRLRGLVSQAPTVDIVAPQEPQLLQSGQGIMIVAIAEGGAGIQRVDFLVNGQVNQQQTATSESQTELTANFPWFSSGIGMHELSVVAYDALGSASEPAQVQVEVQAMVQGLRQAYLAEFQVVSEEEPGAQVAEETGGEEAGGEEAGGEAQEGSDGAGQDEENGAEQGEEPAQAPGDQEGEPEDAAAAGAALPEEEEVDAPEDEDSPPSLILEVSFERQSEGGAANISLIAEDDLGVDWIELRFLNEDGNGQQPIQRFCDGAQVCEFNNAFPIELRQWWFSAIAFDLAGQASAPQVWQMEAMGEPQAFAFHDALPGSWLGVSPEGFIRAEVLLDAFAPQPTPEGDDDDSDQEWIDYVLQERPESFFVNGCLIVQPVVLPLGPFTECQHWDLHAVDLQGIDLHYANFGHSDLSKALLGSSNLEGAILGAGNLSGADLWGANLTNAQLDYTNLKGASIEESTQISDKWRLVWKAVSCGVGCLNRYFTDPVDFRFAYLRSANLEGVTLTGDLTAADMREANLENATLNGANASRAFLMGSNLIGSHLNGVNFHDANFEDAFLTDAHLVGSNLSHANLNLAPYSLNYADLSGADLSRAILSGSMENVNFSEAKLRGANIKFVHFADSEFRNADFTGARLDGVDFTDSDNGTNFVNWRGVTLPTGADPYRYFRLYDVPVWLAVNSGGLGDGYQSHNVGYYLGEEGTKLMYKDFRGADLHGADLREVLLYGSWLQDANLYNAKLQDAKMRGANLRDADLRFANLQGADMEGVILSDADLRQANLHYAEGLTAEKLVGTMFESTTCPDGTNSDDNINGNCIDHLFVYTGTFQGE